MSVTQKLRVEGAGLLQSKALLEATDVLEALLSHLDVCPRLDCFGWQGLADEIEDAHQKAQASTTQVRAPALRLLRNHPAGPAPGLQGRVSWPLFLAETYQR